MKRPREYLGFNERGFEQTNTKGGGGQGDAPPPKNLKF